MAFFDPSSQLRLVTAALALCTLLAPQSGVLQSLEPLGSDPHVIIIGGVSTLLFNGNPLLRFDGYYVLSDILEIPNLGKRANRYIGYLIQRYLFGVC